jgi:Tfp pilus assembly protein PilW
MTGNRLAASGRVVAGFTVVELLIAITLFGLMSLVLVQTFVSFNRLHRRTANAAVLGQDARFAMELLVREARNKRLEYDPGIPLPAVSSEVRLRGADGATVELALRADAATCGAKVPSCLGLSVDGGTSWAPITSSLVEVTRFDVHVRPPDDPFANGSATDIQPFFTAVLGLRYLDPDPRNRATIETQTSVSSRVYAR